MHFFISFICLCVATSILPNKLLNFLIYTLAKVLLRIHTLLWHIIINSLHSQLLIQRWQLRKLILYFSWSIRNSFWSSWWTIILLRHCLSERSAFVNKSIRISHRLWALLNTISHCHRINHPYLRLWRWVYRFDRIISNKILYLFTITKLLAKFVTITIKAIHKLTRLIIESLFREIYLNWFYLYSFI